ncbi:MAG: methyltransferase family protein [Promethearchaeota archaeon]
MGELIIFPIYIWSLEHVKLQDRFGKERGIKIGDTLGLISGWGFFLFLFGIWISPQPRFTIPIFSDLKLKIPIIDFTIPLIHVLIFIPSIIIVLWFALMGVKEVTLKVAETHRPEKVVITGVYSLIRHPQYLGALLAHLSISVLFSALYSLVFTPLLFIYILFIAWKEEIELVKEFGKEYEEYKTKVPMLIPKLRF